VGAGAFAAAAGAAAAAAEYACLLVQLDCMDASASARHLQQNHGVCNGACRKAVWQHSGLGQTGQLWGICSNRAPIRKTNMSPALLAAPAGHSAIAAALSLWLKETRKLYVCYIMLSVTFAQLSSILLVLMFSGVLCFSTPW
jgi:hypothetical protein